jgi:broad specificity phosphatase PhoE
MAIYLIRHGETELNANRTMQPPETPLSSNGLTQAGRLGERLRDEPVVGILASDLARAAMTAEAVAAATGAPITWEPRLHERNFGDLRGRAYSSFDFDPFAPDYEPPGGESWGSFDVRVDAAWQEVERSAAALEHGQHLAVVTHGLVCRSIVERKVSADGAAVAAGWMNTSLTILEGGGPWRVTLLNCAAHLDEVRVSGPA